MTRLDLPSEAFTRPQWHTNAVFEEWSGGLRLKGYTKPTLRTFYQNVSVVQSNPNIRASWVWYGGQWVRV